MTPKQIPLLHGFFVASSEYKPIAWFEIEHEAKQFLHAQPDYWHWHAPVVTLLNEDSKMSPQDFIPLREQYYAEKL